MMIRRLSLALASLSLLTVATVGHTATPTAPATPAAPAPKVAVDLNSPIGLWETIDDETKKPKSIVRLYDQGGVISGKVEKLLNRAAGDENPLCTECSDERKDKPILGMVIMWGMKKSEDGWEDGKIFDPKKGKTYSCQFKLAEGGKKLEVRGYIGVVALGRTQTWNRVQ